MPADFVGSAFDRFASQPRGRSRGGAGLGLSIVKSFVALHGGTVEIANGPAAGRDGDRPPAGPATGCRGRRRIVLFPAAPRCRKAVAGPVATHSRTHAGLPRLDRPARRSRDGGAGRGYRGGPGAGRRGRPLRRPRRRQDDARPRHRAGARRRSRPSRCRARPSPLSRPIRAACRSRISTSIVSPRRTNSTRSASTRRWPRARCWSSGPSGPATVCRRSASRSPSPSPARAHGTCRRVRAGGRPSGAQPRRPRLSRTAAAGPPPHDAISRAMPRRGATSGSPRAVAAPSSWTGRASPRVRRFRAAAPMTQLPIAPAMSAPSSPSMARSAPPGSPRRRSTPAIPTPASCCSRISATRACSRDGAPDPERYTVAVDLLAAIHSAPRSAALSRRTAASTRLPPYDRDALAIEVDLFAEWYMPHVTGEALGAADRRAFAAIWARSLARLESAEQSWVLRDVHSPNLLWLHGAARALPVSASSTSRTPFTARRLRRRLASPGCPGDGPPGTRGASPQALSRASARPATRPSLPRISSTPMPSAGRNGRPKSSAYSPASPVRRAEPGYLRHIPRLREYLGRNLAHPVLSGTCALV